MKELPQRKNIRLINYDYSQSGLYFITICTKDKAMLLSNIVGDEFHPIPQIQLTPIGYEIIKTLEYIENHNDGICFDKYVIMPNHIHLIIQIGEGGHGNPPLRKDIESSKVGDELELIPKYNNTSIPKIIGQLKSFTNKRFNEICKSRDLILWQRSYYDRIIRNEQEYNEIWNYIDSNQLK